MILLGAMLVAIALPSLPVGLPLQFLKIANEPQLAAGYVLSVDAYGTTFAYAQGGVRTVKKDDILDRFICPTTGDPNGIEFLFDRLAGPAYIEPQCAAATGE